MQVGRGSTHGPIFTTPKRHSSSGTGAEASSGTAPALAAVRGGSIGGSRPQSMVLRRLVLIRLCVDCTAQCCSLSLDVREIGEEARETTVMVAGAVAGPVGMGIAGVGIVGVGVAALVEVAAVGTAGRVGAQPAGSRIVAVVVGGDRVAGGAVAFGFGTGP